MLTHGFGFTVQKYGLFVAFFPKHHVQSHKLFHECDVKTKFASFIETRLRPKTIHNWWKAQVPSLRTKLGSHEIFRRQVLIT